MPEKFNLPVSLSASILIISVLFISACSASNTSTNTPSTTPNTSPTNSPGPTQTVSPGRPGGEAVINSDGINTAKIVAIRKLSTGYPWEMDVLIQNSVDVGTLPNPTKDKVGQVITVKTDQDLTSFKVDQVITARIKYAGDVPKPGITLYIYNIQLQQNP